MRIVSWNVNGLRSAHKKGFLTWLAAEKADVVGVQEVRALESQLPEEVRAPEGWRATHFVSAMRLGYSGVGLFARKTPDSVETRLGVPEMDSEGRLQVARFGRLTVVNCYFPNGNGKERDNSRVPFKLAFYRRLFKLLEKGFRDGERILVMGDFNTAHQEIDLARPKDNRETSGFLPEEREELDRWIRAGWVDTFRHFEKGGGHYSWWSQRFGVRERNVGWRLDYVLASPGAMSYVKRAGIHCQILGSDHCPVSVDLDPKVRR
ncbi:exodeoxyribonuclease III [Archangium violaceum]|uniref:exodeoxyribonuclease III n=1 Tax=Archangium violaceum TaxID=83451 RepID=UPI00194ED37D|nr:exodeoxyribonuclease III [Archangium violaceum]QRN93066.1 exodeoxyribonuclease III [Archangium violaceum]